MVRKLLLVLALLCPVLASGQSWTPILPSSRATDWTVAGLPQTLSTGETANNPWEPPANRAQCGSTLPAGSTTAQINTAIANCSAGGGGIVRLGLGLFDISSNIMFYQNSGSYPAYNGVTLGGSNDGSNPTTLRMTTGATVFMGVASGSGTTSWTGGYARGTSAITVASTAGLSVGMIIDLSECDTGYSGTPCSGSRVDNGGVYICADDASTCSINTRSSSNSHQLQKAVITSINGTTLNIAPPLYMMNWDSGLTPLVSRGTQSANPSANGVEDLTIYLPYGSNSTPAIDFNNANQSWATGVRIIGVPTGGARASVELSGCVHCLFWSNYIFTNAIPDGDLTIALFENLDSTTLVGNNILLGGIPWEGNGASEGNVKAYNYGFQTHTLYNEANFFQHDGGASYDLFEGNQTAIITEDDTWASHNNNTFFRNIVLGYDAPYIMNPVCASTSCLGMKWDAYARFANAVDNVIGSSYITSYEGTPGNGLTNNIAYRWSAGHNDPLTQASSLRWGNCDTATGTCRHESSEIPTTLTGNAAPYNASVPATYDVGCSWFMPAESSTTCTPHPNGGTGLSWWKVVTGWTTFPTTPSTTQTPPFPPAGHDVTGGPYVNGHGYDIPAAIAYKNLPIDTSYQNYSWSITNSAWAAGTETLTVTGLPAGSAHIMGGFQVTGAPNCNSPAGGEFVMTGSSVTNGTIKYALAADPGTCVGGTMKFPNIRKFDRRVYMSDPAGGGQGNPRSNGRDYSAGAKNGRDYATSKPNGRIYP